MKTKYLCALIPFICSSSLFAADLSNVKSTDTADNKSIWQGFYLGLNGGIGSGHNWGNSLALTNNQPYYVNNILVPQNSDVKISSYQFSGLSGPLLGIQAGYNSSLSNKIILGGELDFNWTNIGSYDAAKGPALYSRNNELFTQYGTSSSGTAIRWIATTRSRIGLQLGSIMPYLTGGLAFSSINAHSRSSGLSNFVSITAINDSYTRGNKSSMGWTLGAGSEYLLQKNISLKTEYLYTQFSGIETTSYDYALFKGYLNNGNYSTSKSTTGILGIHQLRIGLNYIFHNFNTNKINNESDTLLSLNYTNSLFNGLYFGLNGGFARGNNLNHTYAFLQENPLDQNQYQPYSAILKRPRTATSGGPSTGIQLGYNYTIWKNLVLGLETDFQWTGLQEASNSLSNSVNSTNNAIQSSYENNNNQLQWHSSLRPRVGIKIGNFMPYLTGGFSYAMNTSRSISITTQGLSPVYGTGSRSKYLTGWTTGLGTEFFIYKSLSLKTEYLYTQYNNRVNNSAIYGIGQFGLFAALARESSSTNFHQVRVGLNYHFNASEENVVTKY